jgi:hypothetical protein
MVVEFLVSVGCVLVALAQTHLDRRVDSFDLASGADGGGDGVRVEWWWCRPLAVPACDVARK